MPKKNNNFFKLEMLFLKILSIRDCYGYEITHSIKELTNGKIDIKEGSMLLNRKLYPHDDCKLYYPI